MQVVNFKFSACEEGRNGTKELIFDPFDVHNLSLTILQFNNFFLTTGITLYIYVQSTS